MSQRQIVLDTETTGLEPARGHRVIEIGGVELLHRRVTGNRFHRYLQPDRDSDPAALEVHGLSRAFLADKPRFAEIAADFLDFVRGAELVIHNAPFDLGFLDHELARLGDGYGRMADHCRVLDTLQLARQRHPGQKNTLDALCKRYAIDNSQRTLHGALLDAEILAEVYLAMTGGQVALSLEAEATRSPTAGTGSGRPRAERQPLAIVRATATEQAAHRRYLEALDRASGGGCLWRGIEGDQTP